MQHDTPSSLRARFPLGALDEFLNSPANTVFSDAAGGRARARGKPSAGESSEFVMEFSLPLEVIASVLDPTGLESTAISSSDGTAVVSYDPESEIVQIRAPSARAAEVGNAWVRTALESAGYTLHEVSPRAPRAGASHTPLRAGAVRSEAPPRGRGERECAAEAAEAERGVAGSEGSAQLGEVRGARGASPSGAAARLREKQLLARIAALEEQLAATELAEARRARQHAAELAGATEESAQLGALLADTGRFVEHLQAENRSLAGALGVLHAEAEAARAEGALFAQAAAIAQHENKVQHAEFLAAMRAQADAAAEALKAEAGRAGGGGGEGAGFSLESIGAAIREAVADIGALPEAERKDKIKALRLRWHPDKNPILREFATEVSPRPPPSS